MLDTFLTNQLPFLTAAHVLEVCTWLERAQQAAVMAGTVQASASPLLALRPETTALLVARSSRGSPATPPPPLARACVRAAAAASAASEISRARHTGGPFAQVHRGRAAGRAACAADPAARGRAAPQRSPPEVPLWPRAAGCILLYSALLCSTLLCSALLCSHRPRLHARESCAPLRACAPSGLGVTPTAALVLALAGMAGLTPEGAWTTAEVPQARRLRAASAAALRSE